MSRKHSIASKKRQSKYTKEERSKRMSALVSIRWANKTKEQRHEYALKMVEARRAKKNA